MGIYNKAATPAVIIRLMFLLELLPADKLNSGTLAVRVLQAREQYETAVK
jgi:hypothetical protein